MPSFTTCGLVMLGGALGSLARFLLALWAAPVSRGIPWGTIGINVLGSFAIGFFGTLTLVGGRYPVAENGRLFFMVGLCGGFTTFSSFSLQTLELLRAGHAGGAALNVVLSVALCLGAVALGHTLAGRLNGGAAQIAQTMAEEDAA